jgi:hypothetical protein
MIKPTVGRVVWYRKHRNEVLAGGDDAPLAAIVVRVWGNEMVNLTVFDGEGISHPRTSVPLVQSADGWRPEQGRYCEWMPYQIGQAAKTEELQKKVGLPH